MIALLTFLAIFVGLIAALPFMAIAVLILGLIIDVMVEAVPDWLGVVSVVFVLLIFAAKLTLTVIA